METNEISVIRIQFSGPGSEQPGISGIHPRSALSLYFPACERGRRFDGDEAGKKKKNKGRTSVRRTRRRTRASAALQGSVFFKCNSKLMNQSPRRAQVRRQFSPPFLFFWLGLKTQKQKVSCYFASSACEKFLFFFFQLKRRFSGFDI